MLRRSAAMLLASPALLLVSPAHAQGYAFPIDIRAQPLSSALRELARETGSELLFDSRLTRSIRAPGVRDRLTVETALARLLAETGLSVRRASSGAWVIERRRVVPPEAPTALLQDTPTPEILVTAQVSQNVDIRRRENDVQPYQVVTGEEVQDAHRDNLDQFLRSRVTSNTHVVPPSLLDQGKTNSQVDLRALGIGRTMMLIDGRRMPVVPDVANTLAQPDFNAIPLHAIDRLEILTGTAGGIHGFGALGGVVNVILKRDYRGAEVHVTTGVSSRGDAERIALEGRLGFTPDGGRTEAMLDLAWSHERPLLIGERDFTQRNRQLNYSLDPAATLAFPPNVNGVLATSLFGGPLTLKPEFGGATLGSDYTYLPVGFDGSPVELTASLLQRAGTVDLSLTPAEQASQLGSSAETVSAIGSLRHDFGDDWVAFVDGIYLRNRGRSASQTAFVQIALGPDAAQNPFTDFVSVVFPGLPEDFRRTNTYESARLTAGLIAPLFDAWRATAEVTVGRANYDRAAERLDFYSGPIFQFGFSDDDPDLAPFGPWEGLQRTIAKYSSDSFANERARNRYDEQSLRLGGPIISTGGGISTLTLLAQRRRERIPNYRLSISPDGLDDDANELQAASIAEESLHAEVKVPLFGDVAPRPWLANLELQGAVRYDRQELHYAADPYFPETSEPLNTRFGGTAVTVGAKAFPLPILMLRASYATGMQPPARDRMLSVSFQSDRFILADPKRGNALFSEFGAYTERGGGSLDLEEIKASTLALGAVVNPYGDDGPRVSLDYSRIELNGEVFEPSSALVLEHEDRWPERVVRGPLTDEDRALGYTGGLIQVLDWTAMNASRVRLETLDATWEWIMPAGNAILRTYGAATWQIGHELLEPFAPGLDRVGDSSGPLEWRANAGVDVTLPRWKVGANIQFFSKYRIYDRRFAGCCAQSAISIQGSEYVEAQSYVDLYVRRTLDLGAANVSIDFGIINLFDTAPPREANDISLGPQYSSYGDPRRRRFELVLSAAL